MTKRELILDNNNYTTLDEEVDFSEKLDSQNNGFKDKK